MKEDLELKITKKDKNKKKKKKIKKTKKKKKKKKKKNYLEFCCWIISVNLGMA